MPSTVPVLTGLTYASVDLQDFPRICLFLVEGGPDDAPDVRGEDRTVPYRDGQIYAPRRAHRLPIVLRGWVSGEGDTEAEQRADTATARQELRAIFDPTLPPATLTLTTEDGTAWTIDAYTESGGLVWQASDEGIPTHRTVSVRLIACDPPEWTASGS